MINFNKAEFAGAAGTSKQLIESDLPEVVFSGRSNVGKSSLINKLLSRKSLARVSATPGKTATINFFKCDEFFLVDLPGYGYARVSRTDAMRWLERLDEYLKTRRQLKRLFILIDSRIGPRDSDLDLMDFCDANAIQYQIVYTKRDKRTREENQIKLNHTDHGAMVPEILETSAEKKTGIESLRKIIGIK